MDPRPDPFALYRQQASGDRMSVLVGRTLEAITETRQGHELHRLVLEEIRTRGLDAMDWHSRAIVGAQLLHICADIVLVLDPTSENPMAGIETMKRIVRRHGLEVSE